MRPFTYDRPTDVRTVQGIGVADDRAPSAWIAGGTTMLDLMKLDVLRPSALVDLADMRGAALRDISVDANGLRLGALVPMAAAAAESRVLTDYPVIAQSLQLAASAQIRNMATLGGNVLQRTRCEYFRNVSNPMCNKRLPGSGCAALDGFNRSHAVFGVSNACIATYPGDFAQALIALDASVEVENNGTRRTIPFAELHRLPGDTPHLETTLRTGDIITSFIVPASSDTRRSIYVKVRDRQSYQFALASAAVAMDVTGGRVGKVRIALGGVATRPWRATEAESHLAGQPFDEGRAREAARLAFAAAQGRQHNAFKIALGQETLVRALVAAHDMEIAG
jgi:xanthine dehydrogenase YagS FAD-binding subunit